METRCPGVDSPGRYPADSSESLFERFPRLYAFCRDHLFRDDTELMARALFPDGVPDDGGGLLELGCGPGFYARRLAGTFGQLRVIGLDSSERQLSRAESLAASTRLSNCLFVNGDARALPMQDASFDAVVVSRLFTILPERGAVLAEMHRVLKPGGRCFVAEPRSALRAAVPLRAMQLLAVLAIVRGRPWVHREPRGISVLDTAGFRSLVESQPWGDVRRWQDVWYQYAVCEKRRS